MSDPPSKPLPAGLRRFWARLTSLGRDESCRVLFEGDSPHHHVIVSEHKGVRTMHLGPDGAEAETSIRVSDPEAPVFENPGMMLLALALAPSERILMLGLGGGYLPTLFQRRLAGHRLTVVEVDPLVAELAGTWFGFQPGGAVELIVKDGLEHVSGAPDGAYDQIWLDAFGGDYIPPHLADADFLRICRLKIAPDGLLVQNLHQTSSRYYHQLRQTLEVFEAEPLLLSGARSANTVAMSLTSGGSLADKPQALLAAVKAFGGQVGPYDLVDELRKVFHEPRLAWRY
jgi:spermidine synthase